MTEEGFFVERDKAPRLFALLIALLLAIAAWAFFQSHRRMGPVLRQAQAAQAQPFIFDGRGTAWL